MSPGQALVCAFFGLVIYGLGFYRGLKAGAQFSGPTERKPNQRLHDYCPGCVRDAYDNPGHCAMCGKRQP